MLLCVGVITLRQLKITQQIIVKLTPIILREIYQTRILRKHRELLNTPETIVGELVTFKKFSFKDFESYYSLVGNPHCTDLFFINSHINMVPTFDLNHYLYLQLVSQFFGNRVMYSISDNKRGEIEGMIELILVHDPKTYEFHHYEIAGFARPRQWGTGTAIESVKLASNIFFKTSKEDVLYGYVFAHNYRCQTFLTKCGFNFSHICEDAESKNELVFAMKRPKKLIE